MKKYEYMTVDLSAEPSFNVHIKLDRYIEKLNEYGKQGWRLISGTDDWKYSIFEREIDERYDRILRTGLRKMRRIHSDRQ